MSDRRHHASIDRRSFLKNSVVAVAAAASQTGAPAVIPARSLDSPVVYGLIGAGSQGRNHLRNLSTLKSGRCAVLCDTHAPNLAKGVQAIGGRPDTESGDYRRVLERKDIEAVFITTPYHLHVPMLLEALSAGKHVFVEKCLMKEEAEIPRVYEAKQRHPELVLQVGLQRRYSGVYRNAMRMIHTGVLGRVMTIRAQWHRNTSWRRPVPDPGLERRINWRMYREYSGGLMAELGSHMADVANWAFESEPVSVTGVGGNDYWKDGREIFDNVAVIYEYPQGQKFLFSAIGHNRHLEFAETILGDRGTLEITLGRNDPRATFYPQKLAPGAPTAEESSSIPKELDWMAGATILQKVQGVPILSEPPSGSQGFVSREVEHARRWLVEMGVIEVERERNPIQAEDEHFFECIRQGKKPLADLDVGTADSRAVIYANRAMDRKERVTWPGEQPGETNPKLVTQKV